MKLEQRIFNKITVREAQISELIENLYILQCQKEKLYALLAREEKHKKPKHLN